jgi:hypothetical protein
VVLDIEPVADVQALPVDRDRLARERVQDDDGDQLFGEVEGAVVVGAVGHHHRQAVGFVPGAHEVVGAGFRGGVGAVGGVGRVFGELSRRAEGAEDLVGRDVVEAEGGGPPLAGPVGAGGFQHLEGAHHVGLDEGARAVDRAVDMAFGGEVHHGIGSVFREDAVERGAVADVGLFKGVAGAVRDLRHVGEVRSVGQRVEVHDLVALPDRVADDRRADEAGAAGDEEFHGLNLGTRTGT